MDLVANNLSYKPDDQYHLNEVSFNFHEKFDFVEIDTKKYSDDYEVSLQKRIL